MQFIKTLKQAGFSIALNGAKIHVEYAGEGGPPEAAKDLLDVLRDHKPEVVAYLKKTMPRPYLDIDGSVVIPFASAPCFHWWASGKSIRETEEEIKRWMH